MKTVRLVARRNPFIFLVSFLWMLPFLHISTAKVGLALTGVCSPYLECSR